MSFVLPLLIASSLTAGAASTPSSVPAASLTKDVSTQNVIRLNRLSSSDTFVPPANTGWSSSCDVDRYDYPDRSNEQPYNATPLVDTSKGDFREKNHWKTSVQANLTPDKRKYNDTDCYYFDLFSDSTVALSMMFPSSNRNFYLNLEKLVYSGIRNKTASKDVEKISSFNPKGQNNGFSKCVTGSNLNISFSSTLEPGTYYLSIASDYNCSSYKGAIPFIDYSFSLDVTCLDRNGVYNIADLRYNKSIGAAMWCSDLRPIGAGNAFVNEACEHIVTSDDGIIFQDADNYFVDGYRDYALESMQRDARGSSLLCDCLYIWDKDIASSVLSSLQEVESALNSQLYQIKKAKENIEITTNIYDKVSEIVFTGLEIFGVGKTVVITVHCLERTVLDLVQTLLDWAVPHVLEKIGEACGDGTWISKLIYMIGQLENALEIKAGTELGTGGNYEDALVIPLTYYSVYNDGNPYVHTYKKVKFNYLVDPDENSEMAVSSLYESNNLYSVTGEDLGCCGKFYAYNSEPMKEAMEDVNQYQDVLRNPVQYTYEEFSRTEGISDLIYTGDYRWYSFTAPTDGIYLFQTTVSPWIENGNHVEGVVPMTFAEIELFRKVVAGYQDGSIGISNYLKEANGNYYSYIDYHLNEGQTVYLRIRGNNYDAVNTSFSVRAVDEEDEETYHVHTGTTTVDNGADHSILCWHDGEAVKTADHEYFSSEAFDSKTGKTYRTCKDCGHRLAYTKYGVVNYGSSEK